MRNNKSLGTARRDVRRNTRPAAAVVAVGLLPLLAACGSGEPGDAAEEDVVTLVTHDSFAVSDEVLAAFEKTSGLTVEQVAPGDAGTLVNQLVLTKDSPLGDVVYGVDNSFASRAVDAGVFEPYQPEGLAPEVAAYAPDDLAGTLTPIDVGDVCLNLDDGWFEEHDVPPPTTLDDLTDPAYADLTVVTNPATSSPGLAFLLATVGAYGEDGFEAYWADLRDNGLKVAESWEDAYYVDFSGAGEGGQRPIALSYATSPAFTVSEDGATSSTSAMLGTCFRQVEYAGVLAGTDHPDGARQLVDFLASEPFQADVPGQMYMYPADPDVELPADWQQFAPLADEPYEVPPAQVAEHRDDWIERWTATVVG
ncbi:thiamine ABC transporter substrate-binding protein [Isoptericola sp. NEAU-Y5]|uniref:Thiamine ABC transporter substrate-binding protein n=1 Tax=Isoptericola luteus TaxID=2879484 RepID=A0ABS7ZGV5_9MICO|nr:thiamine ABC transporter substrate-binding protein [Isoptericola sp. NEAU-Y5]MCA5894251.1 thiamine ABC transporter substrate-binding protein [Isoptericola sp. NEAU-Y5]